jgi:rare lipoprotein A
MESRSGGLLAHGEADLCWKARRAFFLLLLGVFIAAGCRARPSVVDVRAGHALSGMASWYGKEFNGRPTASGAIYDMYDLTAAHRTLPFGTMVEVTNLNNGRRVVVEINDRGPFVKGRVIDLSYEAARQLGMLEEGTVPVALRVLLWGEEERKKVQYRVQVGAFVDWTRARRLQKRLKREFRDVIIQPWVGPKGRFYRVRVGPFDTLREAEIAAGRLEDRGLTTFLVRD